MNILHGKLHDGVNNVTVIVLKGLDSHASSTTGLAHHQLDVLGVHTSLRRVKKSEWLVSLKRV
jgi:hypothetical protein